MSSQTRQIQYEHDTWKRVLYHMMDENVHFKLRLSEILKSRSDKKFIAKAELFQHRFIIFDDHLFRLKSQLATLDKNIKSDTAEANIMDLKLSIELLRKNMVSTERQLIRSRINFVCYLVKICYPDSTIEVIPDQPADAKSSGNKEKEELKELT